MLTVDVVEWSEAIDIQVMTGEAGSIRYQHPDNGIEVNIEGAVQSKA